MARRPGGKRAAMLAAVKRAIKVGVPSIGVYVDTNRDQSFWLDHLTDKELSRIFYVRRYREARPSAATRGKS